MLGHDERETLDLDITLGQDGAAVPHDDLVPQSLAIHFLPVLDPLRQLLGAREVILDLVVATPMGNGAFILDLDREFRAVLCEHPPGRFDHCSRPIQRFSTSSGVRGPDGLLLSISKPPTCGVMPVAHSNKHPLILFQIPRRPKARRIRSPGDMIQHALAVLDADWFRNIRTARRRQTQGFQAAVPIRAQGDPIFGRGIPVRDVGQASGFVRVGSDGVWHCAVDAIGCRNKKGKADQIQLPAG